MADQPELLLERESELALIERRLERLRVGDGGRLLIEGPAGIGKSALIAAACARAAARGVRVIACEAREIERQVAFAVTDELLGPDAPERAATADPGSVAAHLAQSVLELAGEAPVLVVVDDVQWADAPSLRWLALLARRLARARVLLVLGLRSGEADPETASLSQLLEDRHAVVIRPAPLTDAAGSALLAARLGTDPSPELVELCQRQAGGNPFLLSTLGDALRQAPQTAAAPTATLISDVGARALARSVNGRLEGLDADARALVRAAAVLGDLGAPAELAALAGLDPARSSDAAWRLADAGLLRSAETTTLTHPLVQAAIRSSVRAGERERMQRAAAARLAAQGRVEAAAARLLELPPSGDPAVVDTLASAAEQASARGAPEVASVLLRRALAEPAAPELAATLRPALGQALLTVGHPDAVGVLSDALDEASEPVDRAPLAFAAARALIIAGRAGESAALLERVAREQPDAGVAEELAAQALFYASFDVAERAARRAEYAALADRPGASELAHRMRLHLRAREASNACRAVGETVALAERALAGGALLTHAPDQHLSAAVLLAQLGETRSARTHLEDAIASTRASGQRMMLAVALAMHGETLRLEGDLAGAEGDLRTALELVDENAVGPTQLAAGLLEALVDQGDPDGAERELRRAGMTGAVPESLASPAALHARGRARAAAGATALGLEDVLLAGEQLRRFAFDSPAAVPWRGTAAELALALGAGEEAARLSAEHRALAERIGAPKVLGPALRIYGRAHPGDAGREALERAVRLLEGSTARLELARAQVDLGAALSADGDATRGRELLRAGAELAATLGAAPLAEQATARLVEGGARPRRPVAGGLRALTPAERRVAGLAAQGLSNREIAETLVVTTKTVETHLASVYRKLRLGARAELTARLAGGASAP
jgi:DNA-binding CsgD family transcriptional regulator